MTIADDIKALPPLARSGGPHHIYDALSSTMARADALAARLAIAEGLLTAMEPTLFAILDGGPDCDCDAQHVCGWSSFSKAINEARAYLAHRAKEQQT